MVRFKVYSQKIQNKLILVRSNKVEASLGLSSIMQNIGFGNMFRALSKRSSERSTQVGFLIQKHFSLSLVI